MNFKLLTTLLASQEKTYTGLTSLTIVNPNEVKDETNKQTEKKERDPNLFITLPK